MNKQSTDYLLFDNRTEKDLFSSNNLSKPFYADIVKRWICGEKISEDQQKIIVDILIYYPDFVIENNKSSEFTDYLKKLLTHPEMTSGNNPEHSIYIITLLYFLLKSNSYDEALELLTFLSSTSLVCFKRSIDDIYKNLRRSMLNSIVTVLQTKKSDNDEYTKAIIEIYGRVISLPQILCVKPDFSLNDLRIPLFILEKKKCENLRKDALFSFEIKKYDEAKSVYYFLVMAGFELSGSLIHLARIALVQDKIEESETYTELACRHLKDASIYVHLRTFWFKIFFNIIRNGKKNNKIALIYGMKKLFSEEYEDMDWKMSSVLDYIKTKISDGDFEFLSALLNAIIKKDGLTKLEQFKEWSEVKME